MTTKRLPIDEGATSVTADPLGAYYLYEFNGLPNVPDYFKFGAWSDGYYMSTNSGVPNAYYAHVFDRVSMLAGAPATRQSFGGHPNFMMPSDVDGEMPPPDGAPNYFYTFFAQGYRVSSESTFPSIRYATRLRSDPLGTLQQEATLIEGGGSQTNIARWGDYSAMTVDPADDCTFWYTTEYHPSDDSGFNWHTRIGTFRLPSCTGDIGPISTLMGTVTDSADGSVIEDAHIEATVSLTQTGYTTSNETSNYSIILQENTNYTVTALAYGYQPSTITAVSVVSGTTTTLDVALDLTDFYVLEGTVTDSLTEWPLYASINFEGEPVSPPIEQIWTHPETGYYTATFLLLSLAMNTHLLRIPTLRTKQRRKS